ncbi:MAG: hypothetical protein WBQ37_08875 [Candidatus Competibacter sp.]
MTAALQADRTERAAGIDLVLFSAGGLTFAVESAKVRALEAADESEASNLANLLGLPAAAPVAGIRIPCRRLRLLHPSGELAVHVDEPVIHCRLSAAALHPLPLLLAAVLTLPCVCALAHLEDPDGESLAVVLDPAHLPIR